MLIICFWKKGDLSSWSEGMKCKVLLVWDNLSLISYLCNIVALSMYGIWFLIQLFCIFSIMIYNNSVYISKCSALNLLLIKLHLLVYKTDPKFSGIPPLKVPKSGPICLIIWTTQSHLVPSSLYPAALVTFRKYTDCPHNLHGWGVLWPCSDI